MKQVVSNEELKKLTLKAVDLLCNAVSSTLGPSGNNVIINTDEISPYITNDGVTIASSIESEDKKINTILEIIKEASLKTNELVGDGTTTTLVLLQSIFKEGLKEIDSGKNSIVLKKELNDCSSEVINEILNLKQKARKKDLESIATISSNDNKIGLFLSEIFYKMKSKYSIILKESKNEETYYEIKKGYNLEIDNISNLYFKEKDEIVLNDVNILIIKGYLDNLEQISEIVNEVIVGNKDVVIFVEEINDNLYQEVLLYYLQEKKNIFVFKLPDFASRRESIEEDISIICNSKIKNINYEDVNWNDLGLSKELIIKTDEIILLNESEKIVNRLNNLEKEFKNCYEDYEREFLSNRISKFKNGVATIYVGGTTKTEIREKLMRFDDALCALETSSSGIVIGEGITLLEVSNHIYANNSGAKIIKNALQVPFKTIMKNAGEDYKIRLKEIESFNYKKIFNFDENDYENIEETKIIDPVKVVITALKNAISIASLLLTTNYLVINENIKIDKEIL